MNILCCIHANVVCIICVQINALIFDVLRIIYSTRLFPKGLLHIGGGAKVVIFTFHIICLRSMLKQGMDYIYAESKRNHWFNKMTIIMLQREISESNCYHYAMFLYKPYEFFSTASSLFWQDHKTGRQKLYSPFASSSITLALQKTTTKFNMHTYLALCKFWHFVSDVIETTMRITWIIIRDNLNFNRYSLYMQHASVIQHFNRGLRTRSLWCSLFNWNLHNHNSPWLNACRWR